MPTVGKTPVNQLNALPLQDADTAAAGGQLQVIAGAIVRYFDAATLGIAGISMPTFGAPAIGCLVTPFLDLRGCNKFAFSLRCVNNTAARAALAATFLVGQYRLSASDVPAVVYQPGGALNELNNSWVSVSAGSVIFAATSAIGEQQTSTWAWDYTQVSTGIDRALHIGSDVRFIFTTKGAAHPAANLFTATLWASS